jgi:predicted nucleic-acid-binding Zn-ribbon protein
MGTTERQVIGHCGMCGVEILADHPYAWCSKCGTSLPPNVKEKLGQPQRQDPPRPTSPPQEGTVLMVEGTPVACPICRHDRYRMKKTLMESKAAAFLDVEWASPSADTYICLRCGHVMWFLRG